MIDELRPEGPYYKQSMGDFLLFLTRVDGMKYDILEQEELKKKRLIEMELKGEKPKDNDKLSVKS
jgi:hypothetical protein